MTELSSDLSAILPDPSGFQAPVPFYKKKSFWIISAVTAAIFGLNFFVFYYSACYGFNKIDWGSFMEAAWRIDCGQKIYQDYLFHSGPFHLYMCLLFYKIFGWTRMAIWMHLTVINTIAVALTFAASWRRLPIFFTLLCTSLTQIGYYWAYPHPYYDYTGHLFGLAGILALSLSLSHDSKRSTAAVGFFCGLMAALTCLTKINIGAAYSGIFGLFLLTRRRRWTSLASFAAGIAAVLGILSFFVSLPAMFFNMAEYQPIASQRLVRFIMLPVYFKNFFWLPFVLLYLATMGRRLVYLSPLVLCLGLGTIAIFTINTGSYRGTDYLLMSGMYMVLTFRILFSIFRESVSRKKKTFAGISIAVLTGVIIYQMAALLPVIKGRIQEGMTASPANGHYQIKNGSFRGWSFDWQTGNALDGMIEAVQKIPKQESLLVLSHMQMIYPFAKKESYKNIPTQWYVPTDPPPQKRPDVVRYLLEHKPDWILASQEEKYPVNEIVDYLGIPMEYFQDYVTVASWGPNGLMKRRT